MKPNKKERTFEELWENPETRELLKEIVIARIKQMPDNFRLSIG
jgi:hypothetical protein